MDETKNYPDTKVYFDSGGNPKRTQDFGIPLFVVGFVD